MLRAILPSAVATTKRHAERKILRVDPNELFNIITDVDKYSQFLPLCTHSKILRRSDCGTTFDATLTVGLPPLLSEDYVSRVKVDEDAMTVNAKSIRSQKFDSLRSSWRLRKVPSGGGGTANGDDDRNSSEADAKSKSPNKMWCDVEFEVEMTVSDPIIVATLDKVLQGVAGNQMEAFRRRCAEISPQRHGSSPQ